MNDYLTELTDFAPDELALSGKCDNTTNDVTHQKIMLLRS